MNPTQSITDIVLTSGTPGEYDNDGSDFDLLRDAVVTAGLADALADEDAMLTVFAPNDDAFIGLATTLGYGGNDEAGSLGFLVDALTLLGGGDPIPLLTDVLTYHVVDGAFDSETVVGLGDGAMISTLQGGDVTLNLGSTPPSLGDMDAGVADPGLIAFDIEATNGIIHVLDGVLLPVSVTDILSQPDTDFVIGASGAENIRTREGNDFVDGNGGRDMIRLGSGDDIALGGNKGDKLFGRQGDDTLLGENGNDKLRGGEGNDILDGGAGRDMLFGGHGNDVFVFADGSGRDTVVHFVDGDDLIDVSGFGIESWDEMSDMVSGRGHRTQIDFGDGDVLTLLGTDPSTIDQADFIFA